MSTPTRYPCGVTTAKQTDPMGQFILPDPTTAHVYVEDFDYYVPASWVATEVGTATQALPDGDGGKLLITNDVNDDDSSFSLKVGGGWLFETGKKLWFDCLFQTNDATQSDIIIGIHITDTTPLDVTDGVFFLKSDGAATVDLVVTKDGTATTTAGVATLVDATDIQLSYFYDGVDSIKIYANGVHVATSATTNLVDDAVLTVSYGIQNGEAAAKTMLIDRIVIAKER